MSRGECWKCKKEGRDTSGDNAYYYPDGGVFCWAGHGVLKLSDDLRRKLEQEKMQEDFEFNMTIEFTKEQYEELKKNTSYSGSGYRSIRDDIYKYFGILHEYNTENGELDYQYYPVTTEYEFSGLKRRELPKKFECYKLEGKSGVGVDNDLFGQFRFKNASGKYVLIVGGEIDQLSAFQMLKDYQSSRGYDPIVVVSPTIGESGCAKQLQRHYSFFDRFERIIVCMDNDEAGREATDKIVKVLPRDKVFVMDMRHKDPNEYLEDGKEREFVADFFNAHKYTPTGIIGSDCLYNSLIEKLDTPKISFPPMMRGLNKATAGGIRLKKIVNILAGSGSGKTTYVNAMIKHWIYHAPVTVGVVSLEADAAEYASYLLSEHIGKKLSLIEDNEELKKLLLSEDVKENAESLFQKEDGSPRFYLIDDRGVELSALCQKIEELIISCGVQLIVIDPWSDALAGVKIPDQELAMGWMKKMVKAYDVTFICINHTSKGNGSTGYASKGADLAEEQIIGSSTIYKSASLNITLVRDKTAEDLLDRNTTKVTVTKNRDTGITGLVDEIYYDQLKHRLFNKEDWLKGNV